jgi:hypothetical protein
MVLRVIAKKSSHVYVPSSFFSSSESSKFGSLPQIKAALHVDNILDLSNDIESQQNISTTTN